MADSDFEHIRIDREDIRIILEFPQKSEKDAQIARDVQSILSNALREQLQNLISD